MQLVDLRDAPIRRVTAGGIETTDAEYPFDIIIYATGFDAVTGASIGSTSAVSAGGA